MSGKKSRKYVPLSGPLVCVWEITLACNMRCLHCGSYAGYKRSEELTTEQALKITDELAQIGVKRLTLSGGELLLRDDWFLIARRLIENGVRVGLISNGYLMLKNLPLIKKLTGLEIIAMSVDGMRETHDSFRQVKGSFDRVTEAFSELERLNIRTGAITSVSSRNLGELDEIHDLLACLGVKAWQIQTLFGGGRMREHPELMPRPEDLERIARFVVRKRSARSPVNVFVADGVGYFTELEEPMRGFVWRGCQAGLGAIGIEANGNVKGCLSLYPEAQDENPFVEGNVLRQRLIDIWNRPGAFSYNRNFDKEKAAGFCRECPHLEDCRCGCTAEAYFATGSTYENPYCIYRVRNEKKVETGR